MDIQCAPRAQGSNLGFVVVALDSRKDLLRIVNGQLFIVNRCCPLSITTHLKNACHPRMFPSGVQNALPGFPA